MNVKEVIEIDFIYFFKTGNFDCLILGQTKEWVLNNFPNPDGKYNPETNKVFSIWTYGNIELHFEKEVLFLIYSDSLDNLNGGDFLKQNKWIFDDISKLN
ncbi:MAG: hypothetical protein HRT69_08300 [Flavobacteriaceae bacterium]|nr:hypothetical protein [Flavobacteriaceae bacterium]